MEKTAARSTQPSVKHGVKAKSEKTIFLLAALDMSWRLAFVVLVPIIGGFELDKHTGATPVLTIVGFILAMAGLYAVLKYTLATADERFRPASRGAKPSAKGPRP